MTITLEIPQELGESLAERARVKGLTVDKFLEKMVVVELGGWPTSGRPLTGPEKAEAFDRWADSFPKNLPLVNLEDITREELYEQD